ncbi:MAG: hypothetical protein AAGD35_00955 [Actinomycetota bacterium]
MGIFTYMNLQQDLEHLGARLSGWYDGMLDTLTQPMAPQPVAATVPSEADLHTGTPSE